MREADDEIRQCVARPPEQVVGTAGGTKFSYDKNGKPFLTKEPKLLLNDDKAGKPEGIHLMIGRRPSAAFGNSDGDREMLEYTGTRTTGSPRAESRRSGASGAATAGFDPLAEIPVPNCDNR